jgi:hypothetical protein
MDNRSASSAVPISLEAPRHPGLQSLLAYWTLKRGSRLLLARADIQPSEIKSLLPDVMICNVEKAGGPYIVRLVGGNIVNFTGRNQTGECITAGKPADAVAALNGVLAEVVATRTPRFRTGKAFWHREKSYRDFESCFLPLSEDGDTVNMILSGLKFDTGNLA